MSRVVHLLWACQLLALASTALTLDDFEEGPFVALYDSAAGGAQPAKSEQSGLDPSHTVGGVRLAVVRNFSGLFAGAQASATLAAPLPLVDDGVVLAGSDDWHAWLFYDGTAGGATVAGPAGALALDLRPYGEVIVQATALSGQTPTLELRIWDGSGFETLSRDLVAGANVFELADFTSVDLGDVRTIGVRVASDTAAAVTVTDVSAAQVPVRYVHPSDPTCGGASPCHASIQAAVDAADPGSIVRLQAGEYDETVEVLGRSGLVIEGDPAAAPEDVRIAPSASVSQPACIQGAGAVEIGSSSGITLRHLTIEGYQGFGVRLRGGTEGSEGTEVLGLRLLGNGQGRCGGGIAVEAGNADTLLAHNLVHANDGSGVCFERHVSPGQIQSTLLWSNTIQGNGAHGVLVSGFDQPRLYNNVIAGNGADPSLLPAYGLSRGLSGQAASTGDLTLQHNLFCGNASGELDLASHETPDASGNQTPTGSEGAGFAPSPGCDDPAQLFADGRGPDGSWGTRDDDFFPKAGGPLVDTGAAPPGPGPDPSLLRRDYAHGSVRPMDGDDDGALEYDLGALEWGEAPDVAITDPADGAIVTAATDELEVSGSYTGTQALALEVNTLTATQTGGAAGTFTAAVPLAYGSNDVEATASNPFGLAADAIAVRRNRLPVLDPIGDWSVPVGSTLSIQLGASDGDADALRFAVAPLPMPEGASFDVAAGMFRFTPGLAQVGDHTLVFSVSDGIESAPETVTITVTGPAAGAATAVSGVMLDAEDAALGITTPIAGVTIRDLDDGVSTMSGADGTFTLSGLPSGERRIEFDASTVTGSPAYGSYRAKKDLVESATLVLARPIYLPRLSSAGVGTVDPSQETVITHGDLDVTLTIPAGSVRDESNNLYSGSISISEVPVGFTPGALPDTLEPAIVLTIQPMGLTFTQPAAIRMPNTAGLAAGTQVNIWSMDHSIGQFFIAGIGEVSSDGQWIDTVSGGVQETSWHFTSPPAPSISAESQDGVHDPCACTKIRNFSSDAFVPDGAMSSDFELPAHVSQDAARALRFVYRSDRAHPYPAIPIEPTVPFNAAIPDLLSYELEVSGVDLPEQTFVDTVGFDDGVNNTIRASLPYDASELGTGVYPINVRVTSHYGDAIRVSDEFDDEVVVVNERASAFGAGWGLAGLQRMLHDVAKGTALVLDGGGAYARFEPPDSGFGSAAQGEIVETTRMESIRALPSVCAWRMRAFPERAGVTLGAALQTDVSEPGPTSNPSLGAAVISVGTVVSSHLIHVSTGGNTRSGSIAFDRPILGLLVSRQALNDTDATLGHPGTDYSLHSSQPNRETLDSGAADRITISEDRHQLDLTLRSEAGDVDQIRVLTAADPGDEALLVADDFDCENGGHGTYGLVSSWNWNISDSNSVSLLGAGPAGSGLSDTDQAIHVYNGSIESKDTFDLVPGVYTLSYAAGARSNGGELGVNLGGAFETEHVFAEATGVHGEYEFHAFQIEVFEPVSAKLKFESLGGSAGSGISIDNVRLQRGDQHVFAAGEFASSTGDPTRLVRDPVDGTAIRSYPDGTAIHFDAAGFQTAVVDRNGNTTAFAHDALGRLETITDPTGAETSFTYLGDRLDSVTDPAGRQTLFDHDAAGNLERVTLPDGSTREFGYDGRHLLTDEWDGRGLRTIHAFDDLARLVSATLPDGSERFVTNAQTVGYVDLASGVGSESMPAPEMSPEDGVSTFTDAEGRVTTYDTAAFGAPTALEGPDGLTTQIQRDVRGNPIRTEHPSGHIWTRAFDERDNLLRVTDGKLGGTTSMTYHPAFARVTTVTDGLGTTSFEYHPTTGDLEAITTPEGRETAFTYHGADTEGEGGTGQIDTVTDPLGTVTDLDYADGPGESGNVEEIRVGTGSGQRITRYTYTSEGYVDTLTEVLDTGDRVHDRDYDEMGRVIRETVNPGLSGATVTEWTYDDEGNLEVLLPPGRPAHVFRYDTRNREEEYEPPPVVGVGPRTYFDYNGESQLESIDPPGPGSVSFGYHGTNGRLQSMSHPAGTRSFFYTDGGVDVGLLEEITSEQGDSLQLDYEGTILSEEHWSGAVSGSVERSFDPDGRLDTQTVDDGATTHTVAYAYDGDGLLEEIQDGSGTPVLAITLDPDSGVIDATSLGSVTTSHTTNAFGETDDLHAQVGGGTLYREEILGRDRLGRITSVRETVGAGPATTRDYTYDRLGRLESVSVGGTLATTYGYDTNGNRTGPVSATYDDQDRLTAHGTLTFTYTESGELATRTDTTTSAATSYGYDLLGNLRSVTLPGGAVITYVIDGADRRVGKKVNGTLVQGFLYGDALYPVAELDGSGILVSRFVYGTKANVPDYLVKGGVTYRVLSDHLGSVRLVVNAATGAIAQRLDYDEWGNVTLDTNPGFQPFAFAGGLYDADTKLTRFGARDYEAETGRWTTKDPIRFQGDGPNLYGYVLNDPINGIDPSGLLLGTIVSNLAKPALRRLYPAGPGLFDDILASGAVAGHGKIISQTTDAVVGALLSADPSLKADLLAFLQECAPEQGGLGDLLDLLQAYGGLQTALLGYGTGSALGTAGGAAVGGVFIGSAIDNFIARRTGAAQFGTIQAVRLLVRLNF